MAVESEIKGIDVEPSYIENVNEDLKVGYNLQPTIDHKPEKSKFEKHLILKQDLLILPLLALIYFVTYLVGTFKTKLNKYLQLSGSK